MNTQILDILLLLLLLLVSATSLPLRLPIIHGSVSILVILAVVQNEYFLVKPDIVVVLLRDHIVLVDNLLLGRRLLLPALLCSSRCSRNWLRPGSTSSKRLFFSTWNSCSVRTRRVGRS